MPGKAVRGPSSGPARGLCQAGRRFPHHGKQCPGDHWDAESEAGSTLKTNLTARFFQQGAVGSSKTCHCRRSHGGGGGISLSPRSKERTRTAVLWEKWQPRTLLCLLPIARAAGARRAAGTGGVGEAEERRQDVQEPAGVSIAGTPPGRPAGRAQPVPTST